VVVRGSVKFQVQYFIRAVLSRLPALSSPLNYSPPVSAWLGRHRMGGSYCCYSAVSAPEADMSALGEIAT
jgi:hypothetical protein